MGAQGTTVIDFGSFPGGSDASVTVTGQTGILSGSLVEAWLYPVDTVDHLADEHLVETIKVVAGNIIAGTGFTIYAINTGQINEPVTFLDSGNRNTTLAGQLTAAQGFQRMTSGGVGTTIYGKWTVAWVWN